MAQTTDPRKLDGSWELDGTYYLDGELTHRLREYKYELDVSPMRFRNSSTARRPDAISMDYLTSFSVGPQALGDPNGVGGIVNRVWRVRVVDQNKIMISSSNGSFSGQ